MAMDDQTEADEKVLTFDVADEALERAASAERQAYTWVYCTNGYYWYDCNWPQVARSVWPKVKRPPPLGGDATTRGSRWLLWYDGRTERRMPRFRSVPQSAALAAWRCS
jgi:hypothetical protein